MSFSEAPRVTLGDDEGRIALLLDGVVQSVFVGADRLDSGYWPLMLPQTKPRAALLLGVGGGTVATLLTRRFGTVAMTGVEKNAAMIEMAHEFFGLPLDGMAIFHDDAFDFILRAEGAYDYVAVDLFDAGAVPARVFSRPFLRAVKAKLEPGGLAAINFFKDRRLSERKHRLETVFPRVALTVCEKNVVAHCRAR